jgi:hypothetical protein
MKPLAGRAASFLDSGCRGSQAKWPVLSEIRRGSPFRLAGVRAQTPLRRRHKDRLPIPSSPGSARLYPTSPRAPAAYRCRTERHDGKRNLYLQHAA